MLGVWDSQELECRGYRETKGLGSLMVQRRVEAPRAGIWGILGFKVGTHC